MVRCNQGGNCVLLGVDCNIRGFIGHMVIKR